MEELTIKGELLFVFTSKQHWINKATSWYKPYRAYHTVALDQENNVCHIGEDFRVAEEKGLYPIRVYALKRTAKV